MVGKNMSATAILLLIFIVGFHLGFRAGKWDSKHGQEYGYALGKKTREWLGFPPL